MTLLLGIVQLVIAAILLHRVMPVAQSRTTVCGLRVWFFASAMACYGGANIVCATGGIDTFLTNLANIFFVVSGALWLSRAKRHVTETV